MRLAKANKVITGDLRDPPLRRDTCIFPVSEATIANPGCAKGTDTKHGLLEGGNDASDTSVRDLCLELWHNLNEDTYAEASNQTANIKH